MLELIIGIVAAMFFSFLTLWAYNKGVKTGQGLKHGAEPDKLIPSLKDRKAEKEAEEQEQELDDQISAVLNYDPNKIYSSRNK